MADEGGPTLWGLWNERLTEWFNPGNRRPFFRSREEVERLIPLAKRQYPFGTWEIREFVPEGELEAGPPAGEAVAAPEGSAPPAP
jgi:hypothetical protein